MTVAQCCASFKARGRWRASYAVLVAAGLFVCADIAAFRVISPLLVSPARADDDDDRRERLREAMEERRQRAEERRQRAEERLQRARERQAQQEERAKAAAERAQAAAERAQATAERSVQQRSDDSSSRQVQSKDDTSSRQDTRQDTSSSSDSKKDDDKKDGDEKADKSDSKDGRNSPASAIADVDDDSEPATLVEWFDRLTKPKNAGEHGKPDRGAKPTLAKPTPAQPALANKPTLAKTWTTTTSSIRKGTKKGVDDVTQAQAVAEPASKNQSQKAAAAPAQKAVSNKGVGPAGTAPDGAPRRGMVDFELLQMGAFKQHEIMASGLDQQASERARALGFRTTARIFAPGDTAPVQRLVLPKGMSEKAAVALLKKEIPAGYFGPNHIYRIMPAADAQGRSYPVKVGAKKPDGEDDCVGDKCFARELIHWKRELKTCARSVRVGIIDTSFDTAHPAFAGRNMASASFRGGSATAARGDWHGTAVLSVLAGSSESDTPGLVPDAEFLLASAFGSDNDGQISADAISVLRALAWLDSRNVDLVNMSFSGPANPQIETAIAAMSAKGVIFVAAAGNRGANGPPSYPAAYPQVIAVTAISKDMRSYRHANRGDYVDVAAPGVNIWTALPDAREGYRTGTSFAAPFVTGLLAAMPAARKNTRTKEDVLSRISMRDLGPPGRDPTYGEGLPLAPASCNEIGGVASLPWTDEARRMAVGASSNGFSDFEPAALPDSSSAAMSAFGFSQ
ncbi:MAG: S8 family serine peptidase [Hyphomicrobiaceae bacterium]|nr:S8 family serine peptidase [Hyphomicrobiaceae bacterium]